MKKKIVILQNDTTYIYKLRGAIIKELLNKNYDVYVVAQVKKFEKELKNMGCYIIDIDYERKSKNALKDIKLLMKYKKILSNINPNLVLTFNIKPNIYGGIVCRMLKIKFIPNITGLGVSLEYPGIIQKITIILNRIGLRNADTVFFQNKENQFFFEKHKILSKKTKRVLLPGSGVDLKEHKMLDYPKNDKKVRFLFVARIMKDKGIDIYLETAKVIKIKYPNTEFHVCGFIENEKYKQTLQEYEDNNIIIYHGEQSDMIPFFEMANCIIHPSYYPEGMSNVLLEAAAHGRPVICADRSGCREIVTNNKTGYIAKIKDTDDVIKYVEKIIKMSNEKRKIMGLNARKKIEKEFDRNIIVRQYMKVIK